MIKTKMNGTTANVTRTLDLPKSGGLDKRTLTVDYTIQTGLSSKDAKTDVGKAILKKLPAVLDQRMNALRGKYDNRNIKLWEDAGKALQQPGRTEKDAQKIAKAVEEKIAANWNAYSKLMDMNAESVIEGLRVTEEKKAGEKIQNLKVKVSSPVLKPDRVNLLNFVLQAVTFAGSGPLTWLSEGLKMFSKTVKAIDSATNMIEKSSTEIQASVNQISDGLDQAVTALKNVQPYVARMEVAQSEFNAKVIAARIELDKMTKALDALEKRASKEKAVREGDYLKELRADTQTKYFELTALEKTVVAQMDLQKVMKQATEAANEAKSQVVARRKGWSATNNAGKKNSKDMVAFIGSFTRLRKKLA